MVKSAVIEFVEVAGQIDAPVTKFGGEPCWLDRPKWPLSRRWGVPMSFLCQILLSDVPGLPEGSASGGKMAYVFITETENEPVDPTWDPEGGENAVIVQPGDSRVLVSTVEAATYLAANSVCGISEEEVVPRIRQNLAVRLTVREEPEFVDSDTGLLGLTIGPETAHVDQATREMLWANKLGGVPSFWQGCEYPSGVGPWLPLLQLDDYNELFNVNFGSGRGFAFLSADGTEGRLLWQC